MNRTLKLGVLVACLLAAHATCSRSWLWASEDVQGLEEQSIKAAVARVAPAVVRIETVGGLERVDELLVGTGATTGLIVSDDGYIISSEFNFIQKPDSILVTLHDGSRAAARLVATDLQRRLVLLKIDAQNKLPIAQFVPSGEMRVGQWAIAVGRTFESASPNVSVGIVSALNRIWNKAIQTDAKISPSNYGGPLVDIAGRVLGVLAPLSPDAGGEVAGVDWYDSGIGFAVPLQHVYSILEKLKQGENLYPGILGINLTGADLFSQPAVIAACRVNSPAYKAGLRAGDKIVEAAGQPISRQAQLKHQLGSRYAGDKLTLVVLRGQQRIEREVELAAKLEPYEYPFIGILPRRAVDGDPPGLFVRYVYPDSPAAKAELQPGDRIVSFNSQVIKDADALGEALRALAPGEMATIELGRGEQMLKADLQLGRLPESLPGELPPAHESLKPDEGQRPAVGVGGMKIAEFENRCLTYVPENYNRQVAYGVLVWLHAPGGLRQDELVERFKPYCQEHELILLAPQAADPTKWQPTETAFIRRTLDEIMKIYHVDRARIVVHGHQGGGALAYVVAFANPDVVRAVAAIDAPLPASAKPPENDPVHPLAFFTTTAAGGNFVSQINAGIQRLRDLKYPVSVKSLGPQGRYLNEAELWELVRWIDSLDRR